MGVINISKPVVTLGIYDIGFVSFEQRRRSKRFTKRLNDFVGFTGAIVSGYLLTDKWLNSGKDADPRGEEGMALAASQQ